MARSAAVDEPLVGANLLAAAANVVMQLSRPEVGHGVVESRVTEAQLFRHPVRRTRTTLAYLEVAVHGLPAEREYLREAIGAAHRHVRSTPSSPVAYDASDPELQMWVAACLYRGAEDTLRAFSGPLDGHERERLHAACVPLATTLNVRPDAWPSDPEAFDRYWDSQLPRLAIAPEVREHLEDLIALRFLPAVAALPLRRFHRFVTAGFLAPPFREMLGLQWDDARQRRFDRFTRILGRILRMLPRPVRRFPFDLVLRDVRRRMRTARPLR